MTDKNLAFLANLDATKLYSGCGDPPFQFFPSNFLKHGI